MATSNGSGARRWPSGLERPVVGVIGLGRMGGPMAMRLRRAGYDLVVFDARSDATEPLVRAGAVATETAPGAAASCDVLLTVLPGPAQVDAVMGGHAGAFQALHHGAAWIDLTTSSPGAAHQAAEEAETRGITYLDAPVEGTPDDAAAGRLRILVGGDAADLARVRPILEALARAGEIVAAGPTGAGAALKLTLVLRRFMRAAADAEVLALATRAGVREQLLAGAPAGSDLAAMAAGSLEDGYPLELVTADLALAVDLGRGLGVPLELAALIEQLHVMARTRFGDAAGALSVVRLLEDSARPGGGTAPR